MHHYQDLLKGTKGGKWMRIYLSPGQPKECTQLGY